jgi:hypothetical protein
MTEPIPQVGHLSISYGAKGKVKRKEASVVPEKRNYRLEKHYRLMGCYIWVEAQVKLPKGHVLLKALENLLKGSYSQATMG